MDTQLRKPECHAFIAISLDGFVARRDGSLDWPERFSQQSGQEDYGYAEFSSMIDALVVGRRTFDTALGFSTWPDEGRRVTVLSHSPIEMPDRLPKKAERGQGTPDDIIRTLGASGCRHVSVDGGKTIQSFLESGMGDELILNRIPVLLGRGVPLFGELERDVELDHVRTRAYPTGLVQSIYRRKEAA